MRALVVDDSIVIRTVLAKILARLGFDVVEAGDGLEALARLEEGEAPDVALVDWTMPGMDGYEFVVAVRALARFRELPLMMVSTETNIDQVVLALEAGADEYLMKPFTPQMVKEKLQILGLGVG